MAELDEGTLLVTYPEGRVLRMPDGSLVAEGVYEADDAPLRGRAVLRTPPPPKRSPEPDYGYTMRGRPIVAIRDVMPWERPATKPSAAWSRVEAEDEARARAYSDTDMRRRPAPDEHAPPDHSDVVLHLAARNADVVIAKFHAQVGL